MALEKWLAATSVGLFAMFVGEMFSIYNFMISVPETFEYAGAFSADPKILQFVSIGVAPAGVLAGVAFIMSKHYGSKPIGMLIIAGGIILLVGMLSCYFLIEKIDELMAAVDEYIPLPERAVDKDFLMPVEDVFSITGRGTVATGRIETGVINSGEEVDIIGFGAEKMKSTVALQRLQQDQENKIVEFEMNPHSAEQRQKYHSNKQNPPLSLLQCLVNCVLAFIIR